MKSKDEKSTAAKEILDKNPGVSRDIVEEFERMRDQMHQFKTTDGSHYQLDQPFSVVHISQPLFKNIAKRNRT